MDGEREELTWNSQIVCDADMNKKYVVKNIPIKVSPDFLSKFYNILGCQSIYFISPFLKDMPKGIFGQRCENSVLYREYIEGANLFELITNVTDKSLDVEDRIIISIGICASLLNIHLSGIEHKNLTYENVILTNKLHPIICDILPSPLFSNRNYNEIKSLAIILYSILSLNIPRNEQEIDLNKIPNKLRPVIHQCIEFDIDKNPTVIQIYKAIKKLSCLACFPHLKLSNYINNFPNIIPIINSNNDFDHNLLHFLSHGELFHLYHYCCEFNEKNPGHFHCKIVLGFFFCQSKYVDGHIEEGAKILEESYSRSDSLGVLMFSICNFKGYCYEVNQKLAIQILESNLDDKSVFYPASLYYLGKFYSKIDEKKEFKYMKLSAEQNYLPAMSWLGIYYYKNSISHNMAKKYLEQAANQGDGAAQYYLSELYKANDGNEDKINHYLILSAKNLYINSFMALGLRYEKLDKDQQSFHYLLLAAKHGNVASQVKIGNIYEQRDPIDLDKAFYFYSLAAEQGDSEALNAVGSFYERYKDDTVKAFHYYSLAASKNYVMAKINLGKCYLDGKGTEIDHNKAFDIFKEICETHSEFSLAFYYLSLCYKNGFGVEQDSDQYFYYLKRAADLDYNEAQLEIYINFHEKKSDKITKEEALEYLERSANSNNAIAQYHLGYSYEMNDDCEKAIHWYEKAIENGEKHSITRLGYIYLTEYSYWKAFKLLSQAEDAEGHRYLGVCYQNGYGTGENLEKSLEQFIIAADLGDSTSQHFLAKYYEITNREESFHYLELASQEIINAKIELGERLLTGQGCKVDKERAFELFKEAEHSGDDKALYQLGNCYDNGYGTNVDKTKALHYYILSAEKGNVSAQACVYRLYYDGHACDIDREKVIHYCELAAESNSIEAMLYLFKYYESEKNYEKALGILLKAVDAHNSPSALNMLGKYYEKGLGTEIDYKKSFYYYNLSASQNVVRAQYKLYKFYDQGIGCEIEKEKSRYYLDQSAENGYDKAQLDLAMFHFLAKDYEKAFLLLEKASRSKNEKSICEVQFGLFKCVKEAGIEQAFELLKRFADNNHPVAQRFVGECYWNGYAVRVDYGIAFYYFAQGAEQNEKFSQFYLGLCYFSGTGTAIDHENSLKWFRESGIEDSYFYLGVLYGHNSVEHRDLEKSIKYFRKAKEKDPEVNETYIPLFISNMMQ